MVYTLTLSQGKWISNRVTLSEVHVSFLVALECNLHFSNMHNVTTQFLKPHYTTTLNQIFKLHSKNISKPFYLCSRYNSVFIHTVSQLSVYKLNTAEQSLILTISPKQWKTQCLGHVATQKTFLLSLCIFQPMYIHNLQYSTEYIVYCSNTYKGFILPQHQARGLQHGQHSPLVKNGVKNPPLMCWLKSDRMPYVCHTKLCTLPVGDFPWYKLSTTMQRKNSSIGMRKGPESMLGDVHL